MIFNEEEDEDTLVEEVPQIERGAVLHKGTCHREIHRRNFRDKQFPRKVCSEQDDVKVGTEEEDEDTLVGEGPQIEDVEEDEDTLVEEVPQIESGTVFALGTFNEEEDEDTLVGEGPQIERCRGG